MKQIVREDVINWTWFTEFTVNPDKTVTIHRHFRLHQGDSWPAKLKAAPDHPSSHADIFKEDDKRTAIEFNVPNVGWLPIANPKYIFSYNLN
jgi:hypothetical protein